MKISVTTYDTTYSIETPNDDLDIYQFFEKVESIAKSMGYHQSSIDAALSQDRGAYTEQEE